MRPGAGLRVAVEVADALAAGRPVVALESAIITHGLPAPDNLEVATALEARLRSSGVVPATIGIVGGVPTVGLSADELALLATAAAGKASVRDLPVVAARGTHAGTTVAATATLAHQAGIAVFATGGIGGVHRGGGYDESADIPCLARTPITVVCAGAKSILDIAATLERLETSGVTVLGYRTTRFPGFYVADSGQPVPATVGGPEEVAAIMAAAAGLGLPGAIIVANPVPVAAQLDPATHERVIARAVRAADEEGISGPALTPYLLAYLQRETGGASLAANVAAVHHNVAVAASIALAWAAA